MTTINRLDPDLIAVPASARDIEAVRAQCRKLVRGRAVKSAGMAALPIPGIDVLSDLAMFANVVEEVNRAFGLTPAQIERLQPRMKLVAYQAIGSLGGMLVGKLVTRELIMQLFKHSGKKLAAKSAAKIVPVAGQLASAAIGFVLFRQMGYQHVEACAKVARQMAGAPRDTVPA